MCSSDLPPCGMLADASIFARCMDYAVMVVRHDYTHIPKVLNAVELLAETGVHILGYTINGVKTVIGGYGYGYGYGRRKRGYGYGYVYGQKKTDESKHSDHHSHSNS